MNYRDLPASLQKQVDEKLGKPSGSHANRGTRTEELGAGLPLTCTACGARFHGDSDPSGRIAKHQTETGHARYEWRPT